MGFPHIHKRPKIVQNIGFINLFGEKDVFLTTLRERPLITFSFIMATRYCSKPT
jgi:hypothetical protein